MTPFECAKRFTYRNVKPDLTVSFPALLDGVLEASLLHTESTPHPMAWYVEKNAGFLLTNWQVQVTRYPKWGDEITIRTWPIFFKGVLAERTFEAYDAGGALLLRANSRWAFTDLARRRPIRPDAGVLEGYGSPSPPSLAKDFSLPDPAAFKRVASRGFTVSRRDTDANNHANNVSYIEWAMEDIPDRVYGPLNVTEMKTSYRRECVRGAALLAETFAAPGEDNAFAAPGEDNAFAVYIKEENGNGAPLCEMFFRFG